MPGPDLQDYREVPERITEWYVRHPEGRIICEVLTEPTPEHQWWTVKAACYRSHDPAEPPSGVGHSFLNVPGSTPFTRGSELENAETSAAGRALVMAGIPTSRISSDFEVSMKSDPNPGSNTGTASSPGGGSRGGGRDAKPSPSSPPHPDAKLTPAAATALKDLFPSARAALEFVSDVLGEPVTSLRDITTAQAQVVVEAYAKRDNVVKVGDDSGYGG